MSTNQLDNSSICAALWLLSKYSNNSVNSGLQNGVILKLNKLNSDRSSYQPQMMAMTPSPDDVLDAPEVNDSGDSAGQTNVFCCEPIANKRVSNGSSKQKSTRRRGPGQAVQVLFEDHQRQSPSPSEVRHRSIREHSSAASNSTAHRPFGGSQEANGLSVISSAPQLNLAPLLTCTPPQPQQSPTAKESKTRKSVKHLIRHSSLRHPSSIKALGTENAINSRDTDELESRSYDDMIKFILTEHGIKVISEKEFVV